MTVSTSYTVHRANFSEVTREVEVPGVGTAPSIKVMATVPVLEIELVADDGISGSVTKRLMGTEQVEGAKDMVKGAKVIGTFALAVE